VLALMIKKNMTTKIAKIRTYKMTHAAGFAPNIDDGILTLACCKPVIRRNANVGDWIAGFTSTRKTAGATKLGEEKLVYLMQVTEKLTFDEYWKKYPQKRPQTSEDLGDNIYTKEKPLGYEYFPTDSKEDQERLEKELEDYNKEHKIKCDFPLYFQVKGQHTPKEYFIDISSEHILVSTNFRYFDGNYLDVEEFKGNEKTGVKVTFGKGDCISENEKVQEFIEFVMKQVMTSDVDHSTSKNNSKDPSC
jgi:hypothetical protein